VSIARSGGTLGPAVAVAELNSPVDDNHASVRADGGDIFNSRRLGSILNPGGQPSFDLWVATRRSLHDAWSTPVNLGAQVNSAAASFTRTCRTTGARCCSSILRAPSEAASGIRHLDDDPHSERAVTRAARI